MTHYNESADYWGDRVEKVMGAGNDRLTARSVKVFADGAYTDIWWRSRTYVNAFFGQVLYDLVVLR